MEQLELLQEIRQSLSIGGKDKVETFPGAKRYSPYSRFVNFKAHMHKQNPMLDAVNLAMIVFGSTKNATTLFNGDYFGLKAALGQDILADLLALINANQPVIAAGHVEYVLEDQLVKAFSRKLCYLRNSGDHNEDFNAGETNPERLDED